MILDLTLTPNRSFDPRHTRWLIFGIGGIFLLGGLRFLALGAWPIIPFMVADTALLAWAFRANYASARAHERLTLAGDALTLARVSAQGRVRRFGFEAYWTRVEIEEMPSGDAHLWLAARGQRVRVGGFLSAPERRAVGATIAAALSAYRSN
ncbi:MAG: DUF2244 domain-containing protein [Sandarakinorhabdus sp.]|nr:DUF2244 domain-containing protein [Sandarakinorhabdus sp.]